MPAVADFDTGWHRRRGHLTLSPTLLHVTARPKKVQHTCDGGAASIVTAASSIHCGPNNDWNWADPKADELALKLGVQKTAGAAALTAAGLQNGQAYMNGARAGFKANILAVAGAHYPGVDPTVIAGDTTWN